MTAVTAEGAEAGAWWREGETCEESGEMGKKKKRAKRKSQGKVQCARDQHRAETGPLVSVHDVGVAGWCCLCASVWLIGNGGAA